MKIFSDASEIRYFCIEDVTLSCICFTDDYRGGFLLPEVYFYRAIKIGK